MYAHSKHPSAPTTIPTIAIVFPDSAKSLWLVHNFSGGMIYLTHYQDG